MKLVMIMLIATSLYERRATDTNSFHSQYNNTTSPQTITTQTHMTQPLSTTLSSEIFNPFSLRVSYLLLVVFTRHQLVDTIFMLVIPFGASVTYASPSQTMLLCG